jgi:hypothetical protein
VKKVLFTNPDYFYQEGPPNKPNDSDHRDLVVLCLCVAVVLIGLLVRG